MLGPLLIGERGHYELVAGNDPAPQGHGGDDEARLLTVLVGLCSLPRKMVPDYRAMFSKWFIDRVRYIEQQSYSAGVGGMGITACLQNGSGIAMHSRNCP